MSRWLVVHFYNHQHFVVKSQLFSVNAGQGTGADPVGVHWVPVNTPTPSY